MSKANDNADNGQETRTKTEYEIYDSSGKLITTEPNERFAQEAVEDFDEENLEAAPHSYEEVDTGEPIDDDRYDVECENDDCDELIAENATFGEAMQEMMEHKNSDHPCRLREVKNEEE